MSPKFGKSGRSHKGDSAAQSAIDTWLDHEGEGSGHNSGRTGAKRAARGRKKEAGAPQALDPNEANAMVVEVFPQQCRVRWDLRPSDLAHDELLVPYRRALVFDGAAGANRRERAPVAVGDRVRVEGDESGQRRVVGVAQRTNRLVRPAPGRDLDGLQEHVVVANIDCLCIVVSAKQPDFSPGIVDRYLIAAQAAGIATILCVTKSDLLNASDTDAGARPWGLYRELGSTVLELSVRGATGGLETLLAEIRGKRVAFCGHSGVGKTSLLNAILKNFGRTDVVIEIPEALEGEVNAQTGKGRHTTSSAKLYSLGDTAIIDTPGVREFGLTGVAPEDLHQYFAEFANLACTRRGCRHTSAEQGGAQPCDATAFTRYAGYIRIYDSLVERAARV